MSALQKFWNPAPHSSRTLLRGGSPAQKNFSKKSVSVLRILPPVKMLRKTESALGLCVPRFSPLEKLCAYTGVRSTREARFRSSAVFDKIGSSGVVKTHSKIKRCLVSTLFYPFFLSKICLTIFPFLFLITPVLSFQS